MKIEIFNDENKIDVDNVKFKDFTEETQHKKNLLLKKIDILNPHGVLIYKNFLPIIFKISF